MKIEILQPGQRILCNQCGCHGFGIIAKGYHCSMCSPVMGTRVQIKTMSNKIGQVVEHTGFDEYKVRLKDGKLVEGVKILEIEIIE